MPWNSTCIATQRWCSSLAASPPRTRAQQNLPRGRAEVSHGIRDRCPPRCAAGLIHHSALCQGHLQLRHILCELDQYVGHGAHCKEKDPAGSTTERSGTTLQNVTFGVTAAPLIARAVRRTQALAHVPGN